MRRRRQATSDGFWVGAPYDEVARRYVAAQIDEALREGELEASTVPPPSRALPIRRPSNHILDRSLPLLTRLDHYRRGEESHQDG